MGGAMQFWTFIPEYVAPLPTKDHRDRAKFAHLDHPYNNIYLQYRVDKEKKRVLKRPDEHVALNPVKLWIEDRWRFVRRIFGHAWNQKVFYYVVTRIYLNNDMPEGSLRLHQDVIINYTYITVFDIFLNIFK